jgi:hypothetical protein
MRAFLKRWWIEGVLLAVSALCLIILSSCGPDVAQARKELQRASEEVTALQSQATELRALADKTGNEQVKAAATALEDALKLAQGKVSQMETTIKNLEDSTPAWKAALMFAIPWIPRVLLLVPGAAAVPAAGPILQWLARLVANGAWSLSATKEHKAEDDA